LSYSLTWVSDASYSIDEIKHVTHVSSFKSTPRRPELHKRHGRAGALDGVTPQPAGSLRGNEMR